MVRAITVVILFYVTTGSTLAAELPSAILFDPSEPGAELLAFSGSQEVLRVSLWFFQHGDAARPCTTLRIHSAGNVHEIRVTTAGLGHALLAAANGQTNVCDRQDKLVWREQVDLDGYGLVGPQERVLAILPDTSPLDADGTEMAGAVIASAPGTGTIAEPLKIERLPLSPLMSAVLWTLGIVLPAGFSYWLAREADRWNDRRKVWRDREALRDAQAEAFAAWRQEDVARAAVAVLTDELAVLIAAPNPDRPCARLLDLMYRNGMLLKMPANSRTQLLEICGNDQKNQLLDLLKTLFPEVQSNIPASWS